MLVGLSVKSERHTSDGDDLAGQGPLERSFTPCVLKLVLISVVATTATVSDAFLCFCFIIAFLFSLLSEVKEGVEDQLFYHILDI